MRAYCFGNMYLSSIQQGIQAAHAIARLCTVYSADDAKKVMIREWVEDYETIVLLNGGYSANLKSITERFRNTPYPYASFSESLEALDGALTSVVAILPETVYNYPLYRSSCVIKDGDVPKLEDVDKDVVVLSPEEYDMWEIKKCISNCRLAT